MDLSQVFIDLTSKNNLFNPVESQGSFLSHRFGKRNIPEEHLNFDDLKNFLINENPDQIILESVFGDPFEYNKIEDLFDFCKYQDIQIIVLTNGVSEKIKLVEGNNSYCIFKLYGFTDTYNIVIPNGDFSKVKNNLKYCDKINFYLYKENFNDLSNVQNNKHGIEVEYFNGPTVGNFVNHIMSETGEWIHDVTSLYTSRDSNNVAYDVIENTNYESLKMLDIKDNLPKKSLFGYDLLKTLIKPVVGKSILDTQLPINKQELPKDIKTSVSYKGHLFNSLVIRDLVTNGYIPDWSIERLFADQDSEENKILLIAFSNFVNNKELI